MVKDTWFDNGYVVSDQIVKEESLEEEKEAALSEGQLNLDNDEMTLGQLMKDFQSSQKSRVDIAQDTMDGLGLNEPSFNYIGI